MRRLWIFLLLTILLVSAGNGLYRQIIRDQAVEVLQSRLRELLGPSWSVEARYNHGDDTGHHFQNFRIHQNRRPILAARKLIARDASLLLVDAQLLTSPNDISLPRVPSKNSGHFRLQIDRLRLTGSEEDPPIDLSLRQADGAWSLTLAGKGLQSRAEGRDGIWQATGRADSPWLQKIFRLLGEKLPPGLGLHLPTVLHGSGGWRDGELTLELTGDYAGGETFRLHAIGDPQRPLVSWKGLRADAGDQVFVTEGSWHDPLLRLEKLELQGQDWAQGSSLEARGSLFRDRMRWDGRFPWQGNLAGQPWSGELQLIDRELRLHATANQHPWDLQLRIDRQDGRGELILRNDRWLAGELRLALKNWQPESIDLQFRTGPFRLRGGGTFPGPLDLQISSPSGYIPTQDFILHWGLDRRFRLENPHFKFTGLLDRQWNLKASGGGTLETQFGSLACRLDAGDGSLRLHGTVHPETGSDLEAGLEFRWIDHSWRVNDLRLGTLLQGRGKGKLTDQKWQLTLTPGRANAAEYKNWLGYLPGSGWRALAHLVLPETRYELDLTRDHGGWQIVGQAQDGIGRFRLKDGRLSLESVVTRIGRMDGELDFRSTLRGQLQLDPSPGSAEVENLLGRLGLGRLELAIEQRNAGFSLQAHTQSGETLAMELQPSAGRLFITHLKGRLGGLELDGRGTMEASSNYSGELSLAAIDTATLRSLGFPELLSGIGGAELTMKSTGGQVESQFVIRQPVIHSREFDRLQGRIRPLEGGGYTADLQLFASGAARAELSLFIADWLTPEGTMGRLQLKDFRPGPCTGPGQWTLNPGQLNLQADFEHRDGHWQIHGEGQARLGRLTLPDGRSFDALHNRFRLEDTRLLLESGRGRLAGQELEMQGWMDFSPAGPALELKLAGRGLSYHRLLNLPLPEKESDRPRVELALIFRSRGTEHTLEGRMTVHSGVLQENDVPRQHFTPVERLALDLQLVAGRDLRLRTAIVDAQIRGRIRVRNPQEVLQISGSLQTGPGRIQYLGKSFVLDGGEIQVSAQEATRPEPLLPALQLPEPSTGSRLACLPYRYQGIDHALCLAPAGPESPLSLQVHLALRGHTSLRGREIRIEIAGTPKRLTADFRSEPEMAREEIERMLYGVQLSARHPDEDAAGGDGYALVDFLGHQVQNALWNRIGQSLERQLNLDEFSIRPERREDTGEILGDLEIQIGKYIQNDLFVSYRKMMMDRERDALGLEYRVGQNLFLGGQYNQQNELKMDARVGISF